ncbi:hypothetical protein CW306_26645 [Bacillus sp. BA3]|uniref:hypothetical protein n=1 Tax=Bacillus sp. BA3 TaxID=2057910 RepID=UPI000C338F05|nr:hypothetical protein [Bacillus sp. BA3]PKF85650.1 hypothetical protein CW306_26645 [Bacillus sp. BA3]
MSSQNSNKKKKQPSFFKVYQALFTNETYVTQLTDYQKVALMLIWNRMNRHEMENKETGKNSVYYFNHWKAAAAMSSSRRNVARAVKVLGENGLVDFGRGYKKSEKDRKPSFIFGVAEDKFYSEMDRFTFEALLFEKLKNREITYRHIVVYALCKHIEQFEGGSKSVTEFGRMLGLTVKSVNYSSIRKPLEDLRNMNLINFVKEGKGAIHGIKVHAMKSSQPITKMNFLRSQVKEEAKVMYVEEEKKKPKQTVNDKEADSIAPSVPERIEKGPKSIEDIVSKIKVTYTHKTKKESPDPFEQDWEDLISRQETISLQEMSEVVQDYFDGKTKTDLVNINPYRNIILQIDVKRLQAAFPH